MRRWVLLLLGAAAALVLAWHLAGRAGEDVSAHAPHPEIDEASRRALEQVLEEVERREAGAAPAPAEPSR